ncbi:MAG TPA: LptA/OstA family protein, partial [Rhizomicrobium sp.]
MRHAFAMLLLLAAAPALADPAAPAAQPSPIAHHNSDAPVHIASDSFVAERTPVKSGPGIVNGTYIGNVIITQGDITMRADSVRLVLIGAHAERALANGHIVITSANSGNVTGDSGV